jgi:hypothetical protein
MPVRGCFIGEFCAAIIAFIFPASYAAASSAAFATAAFATAAFAVVTITIHIACRHQCHPFHTEFLISI